MLANQQYQVVDGKPSLPGQVSFQVHQADAKLSNAWVLVANCADGTTCNHPRRDVQVDREVEQPAGLLRRRARAPRAR
jgi:hypothetical protein